MMGLTHHFAPVVVFCGHGSTTNNNAYATALDCGACGGRHGASNARILAAILNQATVKAQLARNGIVIPEATRFIAAEHNTTTDEVTLYGDAPAKLKADLEKARATNSKARLEQMHISNGDTHKTWLRSQDWAEVRPEWGLARNAAFIVAPRDITLRLILRGAASCIPMTTARIPKAVRSPQSHCANGGGGVDQYAISVFDTR